jgi:4-amino-4-deoxy-L-arabinose transferase-like glycosyltransferase
MNYRCIQWQILIALLFLSILPLTFNLGRSAIWDSNEAFYTETPRRMLETGDYTSPEFNYKPRINKPPLTYWFVASVYHLIGPSEFSQRIPIVLWAIVILGTAFMLGRELYSLEAGLLASIIVAAAPRFIFFSRRMLIDMQLTMFMGLTLLFFIFSETRPHRRKLFLSLMYVAVGLGVLTKGPIAAMLPGLTFFIYLLSTRSLNRIKEMMLFVGTIIVASIVLPWYLISYMEHGWLYIESFIMGDNISRFTEAWGPSRGPLFYLPILIGDLLPWSALYIPILLILIYKMRSSLSILKHRIELLLLLWIAVITAFFTISTSKQDYYLLPTYSAIAVLIAGTVLKFIKGEIELQHIRWIKTLLQRMILLVGIVPILLGTVLLYLIYNAGSNYKLEGTTAIGYVLLMAGIAAFSLILRREHFIAVCIVALGMVISNWIVVLRVLPSYEQYRPVKSLSNIISTHASPQAMVGYYGYAAPSMVYYLHRPVFEYFHEKELIDACLSGKELYCLITARDYEAIKPKLPVTTCILAKHPQLILNWKRIINNEDLPYMLVITNNGCHALQ